MPASVKRPVLFCFFVFVFEIHGLFGSGPADAHARVVAGTPSQPRWKITHVLESRLFRSKLLRREYGVYFFPTTSTIVSAGLRIQGLDQRMIISVRSNYFPLSSSGCLPPLGSVPGAVGLLKKRKCAFFRRYCVYMKNNLPCWRPAGFLASIPFLAASLVFFANSGVTQWLL